MTTYLDEIDAWQFASQRFVLTIEALSSEQKASAYIERFTFDHADVALDHADGGTKVLWVNGKIHLMATVVRDELNRSVLVIHK